MKKIFYAFVMMAAAMVGCQNVDENVNINNESNTEGFSVVASVDNEAIDRAIISENEDGTFSPKWVSDDKDNMTLIEFVGSASNVSNPSGMSVSEDGRVATFSGFSFAASEGSSYNYVATVPMPAALGDEFILVNFADVQNDWWENPSASYDALNDMLVSQLITRDQQVAAGEQLDIKMARLNSAMKLVIKGIPASTEVSSVTFSCDQPIAGRSKIMLSDLDGVTYPVPTTLEKGVKSITKGQYFFSDSDMEMVVFLSCMPATLKAGENYTVSIECSDATKLVKKGVLRSAITLEAGEVTTIPVNMSDAATVTKVENLSEECEYAIGYTTADGVTYLLNRTATTKNPAGARISDLGLKINSNGSIEGAVPEAYVWNYSKTDKGESQFYYITNSGNRAHLVSCNKNQGIAILSLNENGVYAGHYASATMIYTDTFTMDAKEGGYYMYVGGGARCLDYNATNGFIGNTKAGATGAVNFYRVQNAAKVKSAVVTQAEDVSDGTYVILAKNDDGNYYAMPNAETGALPVGGVLAEQVPLTFDADGNLTSTTANVSNDYKWIIFKFEDKDAWNIVSAVNKKVICWCRENTAGPIICTKEYHDDKANGISGKFVADWTFFDVDGKGMQARTSTGAEKNRHLLYSPTDNKWKNGVATDAIVLVKLSNSTEQIATE